MEAEIWVEKYRPQTLDDLMVDDNTRKNRLFVEFYGIAGVIGGAFDTNIISASLHASPPSIGAKDLRHKSRLEREIPVDD